MRRIKGGKPMCFAEDLRPGDIFVHNNYVQWLTVRNEYDNDCIRCWVTAEPISPKFDGKKVFEFGRHVDIDLLHLDSIDKIKEFRNVATGLGTTHCMTYSEYVKLVPDLNSFLNYNVEVRPDVVTIKIPL